MPATVSSGKACSRESQPLAGREMLLDRCQLSPQGHGVGSSPATCQQPSTSSSDSHETQYPGGGEGQGEKCLSPPRGRGHSEGNDQGQAKGVTDLYRTRGMPFPLLRQASQPWQLLRICAATLPLCPASSALSTYILSIYHTKGYS